MSYPADSGEDRNHIDPPASSVSVASAVTKVKNLLTGLPATPAEVAAVAERPAALRDLVREWMKLPQYDEKMLQFFMTAFQQDGVSLHDFDFQYGENVPFSHEEPQILDNFRESFARTVLALIAEGRPFTDTMTTRRFMMTPALMAAYSRIDAVHVDDRGVPTDVLQARNPTSFTVESTRPIPIEQSLDPQSPDYMTFYGIPERPEGESGCPPDRAVHPGPVPTRELATFLLFSWQSDPDAQNEKSSACPSRPKPPAYVLDTDFTAWRMVSIRPPRPGESLPRFYDLPAMRTASELVTDVPRVGFFTTPAFLARWATNKSNQARVTLNQTLIVGLGVPVDYTNLTEPASLAALDQKHAAPSTDCYACHESLDPMRQIFRQTYTLNFSPQTDPAQVALPGQFAFHGAQQAGAGIFDLGAQLAAHPMFATAWVQRLCTHATSARCDPKDPEFERLVKVFVDSHFSWTALVEELFSSPIVSYLRSSGNAAEAPPTFPIARQAHLCATLSTRLGLPDVCARKATSAVRSTTIRTVAATWPSDQYGRGNPTPLLANSPSLFLRGGLENICAALADLVVDVPRAGTYSSNDPPAAVESLATTLMGLSGDRSTRSQRILLRHFNSSLRSGASPSDAMKSTFVLACLAPCVAGIGQ